MSVMINLDDLHCQPDPSVRSSELYRCYMCKRTFDTIKSLKKEVCTWKKEFKDNFDKITKGMTDEEIIAWMDEDEEDDDI